MFSMLLLLLDTPAKTIFINCIRYPSYFSWPAWQPQACHISHFLITVTGTHIFTYTVHTAAITIIIIIYPAAQSLLLLPKGTYHCWVACRLALRYKGPTNVTAGAKSSSFHIRLAKDNKLHGHSEAVKSAGIFTAIWQLIYEAAFFPPYPPVCGLYPGGLSHFSQCQSLMHTCPIINGKNSCQSFVKYCGASGSAKQSLYVFVSYAKRMESLVSLATF